MEKLNFKECENCKHWNGCISNCFSVCGKPLDALKEFKELKDLEEQGRLLKLPCAVGDIVYVINNKNNTVSEEKVYDIQYRGETYKKGQRIFMNIGALVYFEMDFGKTVFLTRAEAEQALGGIKDDKTCVI